MFKKGYDFLIIGGGIIGLSIAIEIKRRWTDCSCAILEKEADFGLHTSGRNSGVLHAGFYNTPDTLKAKFAKEGNFLLKKYCQEKKIPINPCGKLVVTKNENDLAGLDELMRRAQANAIELHLISRQEAEKIEPRILTFEKALFSPTTASVNPAHVIQALKNDAERMGIALLTNTRYTKKTSVGILTTTGPINTHFVINAGGLYADKIALDFGYSKNYRILPFKGLYLYSDEPIGAIRTHVYPVPNLNFPFLGVHFTIASNGQIKIGPTAIPAFWREQYKGLSGFKSNEFFDIATRQVKFFFSSSSDFKMLAFQEMQKYVGGKMLSEASKLLKGVQKSHYRRWGNPGIRAQLYDISKKKLETDFVLEGDRSSLHVLNAVSPGFTSAIPFARFVVDRAESLQSRNFST